MPACDFFFALKIFWSKVSVELFGAKISGSLISGSMVVGCKVTGLRINFDVFVFL